MRHKTLALIVVWAAGAVAANSNSMLALYLLATFISPFLAVALFFAFLDWLVYKAKTK